MAFTKFALLLHILSHLSLVCCRGPLPPIQPQLSLEDMTGHHFYMDPKEPGKTPPCDCPAYEMEKGVEVGRCWMTYTNNDKEPVSVKSRDRMNMN